MSASQMNSLLSASAEAVCAAALRLWQIFHHVRSNTFCATFILMPICQNKETHMPDRSPMHSKSTPCPDLIRAIVNPFDVSARGAFDFETCTAVKRIYIVGCGDSHHAPVGAELAFHQLTGVPTQALSSLPSAATLPASCPIPVPRPPRHRHLRLRQGQPHHRSDRHGASSRRYHRRPHGKPRAGPFGQAAEKSLRDRRAAPAR